MLSERPEYNEKIVEAYLLAPAVFMTYATHPIFILANMADNIEDLLHWFGMYEFAPSSDIVSWFGQHVCNEDANPDLSDVCSNIAFAFLGMNPEQLNKFVA